MDFLMNLLLPVTASANVFDNGIFKVITNGAGIAISIVKWAALLYVVFQITILGFEIASKSKNSADALTKVKEKGLALAIGLFIVITAFLIQGSMTSVIDSISGTNTSGPSVNTTDW